MKGYKVFNSDWTCKGFQYQVGKKYKTEGELEICKNGFHFCEKVKDCFNYYSFDSRNKVAEVVASGEIITEHDKSCASEIEILSEVNWHEILELVNIGKNNSGYSNSGDSNSGNWNSGDRNSGHRNSGYRNSGNRNSGHWNSGYINSGNCNSGDRNSGNMNSGNMNSGNSNSGDWNITNNSSGVFNTKEEKITIFNKPSNITLTEWRKSKAYLLLAKIQTHTWISFSEMSDKEKEEYRTAETTGGYLKVIPVKQSAQIWWEEMSTIDKEIIKSIPNFNADIFEEIIGIKV